MTRARELAKLANSSIFSVDSGNNVGINSLTPDAKLDVVGVVSATQYFGDGSNLTGIVAGATLNASSGTQRLVVTSQTSGSMTQAATNSDITYATSTNTLSATTFSGAFSGNVTGNVSGTSGGLTGTPSIIVQDVTAETVSVAGTISYEDVTNVNSVGLVTAGLGVRIGTGGTVGPEGVGVVTYFGDGSQLTGIAAGIGTESATPSNTVVTLDLSKQDHKLSVTGVTTITVSGGTEGDSHTVRIINSASGVTVGFSTYFLFPSGSSPSFPSASGAISLMSFTVNRVGAAGTQLLAGASLNFS
ncbi:hypothetical protein OAA60_04460 [Porticoccaceae bacterium]|nr:hypothetical protein [Porticoccaceae bacterium]